MRNAWTYGRRLVEWLVMFALGHGIILYLATIEIFPDRFVASMITTAVAAPVWAHWIMAGLFGLLGTFLLERFLWNRHTLLASSLPAADNVGAVETAARIPVLDLLHEAEASGWPLQSRDASQRFAQGLRQAVAEGAFEIWGLDLKNGWDLKSAPHIYISERIAPAYFKDHWIEVQQALTHQLNAYTRTSRPAGNEPRFFADLHVDRRKALDWLPSKGILLRDTLKD